MFIYKSHLQNDLNMYSEDLLTDTLKIDQG